MLLKVIKNLNSKLNLEFRVQLRCVSTEEKEVVASKHWNWIDSFTFYENMAAEYQVITNPVVNVTITSTISSFGSERRFQKDLTICNLKVNAWPASFALDHGSFQNMSCTGFGSDSSAHSQSISCHYRWLKISNSYTNRFWKNKHGLQINRWRLVLYFPDTEFHTFFSGQVPISSDIHVVPTFPDMSGARLSCRSWPDCSLRPFP